MKLSIFLTKLTLLNAEESIGRFGGSLSIQSDPSNSQGLGRRYSDLLKIVQHYTPNFDERKYWAYGCNCLILGDRPMSDPGFGKPVDALDAICKQYKDCQKCVKQKFGETCIGEFVRYRWQKRKGNIQCTDAAGTCERNLCECDLDFAKRMPSQYDVFNADYHLFWSTLDWHPQEGSCIKGTGLSEPECCGPPTGPLAIFNSMNKECCPDYSIRPAGMC